MKIVIKKDVSNKMNTIKYPDKDITQLVYPHKTTIIFKAFSGELGQPRDFTKEELKEFIETQQEILRDWDKLRK
jgi:hypothetical protein